MSTVTDSQEIRPMAASIGTHSASPRNASRGDTAISSANIPLAAAIGDVNVVGAAQILGDLVSGASGRAHVEHDAQRVIPGDTRR